MSRVSSDNKVTAQRGRSRRCLLTRASCERMTASKQTDKRIVDSLTQLPLLSIDTHS
ncbi:hypothetical protein DBV15_01218 [Temnothorax longispinosus]|uniref:Uncharacterized protein n=1 Tax=Temnothorax longispinosus TaxID=300112 RepID=A0A4S2JB96_9HYME|nr:hypothetical protein DBV15_01218 [Temnothorax longispinosus]